MSQQNFPALWSVNSGTTGHIKINFPSHYPHSVCMFGRDSISAVISTRRVLSSILYCFGAPYKVSFITSEAERSRKRASC